MFQMPHTQNPQPLVPFNGQPIQSHPITQNQSSQISNDAEQSPVSSNGQQVMSSTHNMPVNNNHFQGHIFQHSYPTAFNSVSYDNTLVQTPAQRGHYTAVAGMPVNNTSSNRADYSNFMNQSFTQLLNSSLDKSVLQQ